MKFIFEFSWVISYPRNSSNKGVICSGLDCVVMIVSICFPELSETDVMKKSGTLSERNSSNSETETEEYVEPQGGLTVTLAVIVIILIIGYALIKGKKK